MNNNKLRLGSISILFTVIIICTILITIAALSYAKADYKESKAYATHITTMYETESLGQNWLAMISGIICDEQKNIDDVADVDNTKVDGNIISTSIEHQGQRLDIELKIDSKGNYSIIKWNNYTTWVEDTSVNLWQEE